MREWQKVSSAAVLALAFSVLQLTAQQNPQAGGPYIEAGQVTVGGHAIPFRIRHLPVSSFPQLPGAVQNELNRRDCLIPQTYEAHAPENVVEGSLEHAGSKDWAVLCSAGGTVSLLVFFAGRAQDPVVLASVAETDRLAPTQAGGPTPLLGFAWGIDAATPEQVREAQIGMKHRPPLLEHDAVAESAIDQWTIYHYFTGGHWRLLETQD